jgi:hypothetical protein
MSSFESFILELDATLQQYNVATYQNLLPSLSDEEIDKGLQELGINDENIKSLFRWKSGIRDSKLSQMMDYGSLLKFDEIKYLISSNKYYDKCLVPLISENGEEILLFNTNPGPHYGKLYLFSVAQLYIEYPVSIYCSLSSMLETTIELYRTGGYQYDSKDNWLTIDFDKYDIVAKKLNTGCVYWTEHDEVIPDWYEI